MNRHRRTRRLHAIHKWTGLLIGFNVLFFSLSSVYMLMVDIVAPEGDMARTPLDPARMTPVQPLLDTLAVHFAGHRFKPDRVAYALIEGEHHELRVEVDGAHLRFRADPYTGAMHLSQGRLSEGVKPYEETAPGAAPVGLLPLYGRLDTLLLQLHSSLALGVMGTLITGLLGVIFLISTVTGWVIYTPFMKALVFGMIRRDKPAHMRLADMHKLVGIAALAFNLVMAVTGIGLTLGLFAIQMQVREDLKTIESRAGTILRADPLPSIDIVQAAAQSAFPGHAITHVDFPGPDTIQGDKVYTCFATLNSADPELLPAVGIVTAERTPRAQAYVLAWWMEVILLGAPVHTGAFGGKPTLFAYLLLSLSSGFLSVTGYAMYIAKWWRRRRLQRARRPAEVESSLIPAADSPCVPMVFRTPRIGPWSFAGLQVAGITLGLFAGGLADGAATALLLLPGVAVIRRLIARR